MVIETINGIGQALTTTVTLFIQVNHWLNQRVVWLALWLGHVLTEGLLALAAAARIALEDLADFLIDTHEMVVQGGGSTFELGALFSKP